MGSPQQFDYLRCPRVGPRLGNLFKEPDSGPVLKGKKECF